MTRPLKSDGFIYPTNLWDLYDDVSTARYAPINGPRCGYCGHDKSEIRSTFKTGPVRHCLVCGHSSDEPAQGRKWF